jgi:uncharacterized alkaline shock family protein YloU
MDENNEEKVEEVEEVKKDELGKVDELSSEGNDTVKISDEAVATYAGIAVADIQGVYSMAGGFADGISSVFTKKKDYAKGIKVDVGEKDAKIDVNIIVNYGARIPDVAFEIQNSVKKTVESMTGLNVVEVNVHVQGVHMKSDKPQDEEESKENENNEENTNE